MQFKHFILAICLLSWSSVFAQQVPQKAQALYDKAMLYHTQHRNNNAIETMQKAIKEYPGFRNAYSILGEWYFKMHRFKEAADVFAAASNSCKDCAKAFAKPLTRSLLNNFDPVAAQQIIYGNATANDEDWKKLNEQAQFLKTELSKPIKDSVHYMGASVNSPYPEMFPSMSADTSVIYFTRAVNGIDQDFYKSTVDSCGGWFYARNMGNPPNTSDQEFAQMISADGHYIFFSRTENRSENGWDRGGCDLYMAYTADSVWSVPQSFGATINTPGYEAMPCLSPDNRELYFASDKPGGYGGLDIWVSNFEDGLWQPPRNMGPEINTAGNESAPFLHIDNQTLYFVSDGLAGMGGTDLFMSRRINDTIWSKPVNMGRPINTSADENSIFITGNGSKAYFSSDRDSAAGDFNLYEIKLPAAFKPASVVTIKGFAYDSLDKSALNNTSIYINHPKTGEPLYHFISNRGDGSYMITLTAGADYSFNADRIGYLNTADTIHVPRELGGEVVYFNIPLLPQDYVAPIHDSLAIIIQFALNAATISDSDKIKLAKALDPWILDKNINILVNGYTDNTGTPLINEQLSVKRASLVAQTIADMGIDPAMIQSQGWGEANPMFPNDTDENMSRNRRVEVIIRR